MWIEYHLEFLNETGEENSVNMTLNTEYIVGQSYWPTQKKGISAAHQLILMPGTSNLIHFFKTSDEAIDVYHGFLMALQGHHYDLMDNLGYISVIKNNDD